MEKYGVIFTVWNKLASSVPERLDVIDGTENFRIIPVTSREKCLSFLNLIRK